MKKIMIATLGLSLLPVGAVFAQNTSTAGTDTNTMKSTHKSKKHKSTKGSSDTMSSTTSTSTSSK